MPVSILVNHVPRVIRQAFRAWCTLRGISMQEKLIAFMRSVVLTDPGTRHGTRPGLRRPGTVLVFVKKIPVDVHRNFKAWCQARGESMQDVLLSYMRETVRNTRMPGTVQEENSGV